MPGTLSWWWYRNTAPTQGRRERAERRGLKRAERVSAPRFAILDLGAIRRRKFRVIRPAFASTAAIYRSGQPGRNQGRRAHSNRAKGALIAAGALVIAAAVFMLVIQSRMRPQVEQVAGAYIRNLASQAVNRAVTDIITDMGVSYDDLIRFEKDNLGRVTALRTDIVTANRVKAGIHTQALENIGALAASDIRIPLGTLLSGDLVVGRGPKIPIRLVPIGSVDVAFTNEFGAAGINQALHRIMINISTNISVMLPGSYTDQEVLVEVCVAETVIVGAVPDAYATLDRNPMFGG